MICRPSILLVWSLVSLTCCQVAVTWGEDSAIQTGQYLLIDNSVLQGTPNAMMLFQLAYTYSITFAHAFSGIPTVCLGIVSLEFNNQVTQGVFLQQTTTAVSQSGLTGAVQYNGTNGFVKLAISIITCDESSNNFLKLRYISWSPSDSNALANFNGLSSGSGYRSATLVVTRATAIDLSHTNVQLPFIKSFVMKANSLDGMLNLGVKFQNINSTNYYLIVWTSNMCNVSYAEYYSITFDQTIIQATQTNFSDSGNVAGIAGLQTLNSSMVIQKVSNFIIGVNYFSFNTTAGQMGFDISISYPNLLTTTTNYTGLNFTYFNYRVRSCPIAYPCYNPPDMICYNVCPAKTYLNTSGSFCSPCGSNCLTCTNMTNCTTCDTTTGVYLNSINVCVSCVKCVTCNSATECLTCDSSLGRAYNSTSKFCDCKNGMYDAGPPLCVSCDATCATCTAASTCLTCSNSSNRILDASTSECKCAQGFYDAGSVQCSACSVGCLTCDALGCQVCNTSAGYTLITTTPFYCILPAPPIVFTIQSVTKQPACNNITFIVTIDNLPKDLQDTDLSKIFDFGLPAGSNISIRYDPVSKTMYVEAAYSQNVQNINVTLDPKNSGNPNYSTSNPTSATFNLQSLNDMAAIYYPPEDYNKLDPIDAVIKTMLACSLFVFLAGLYSGKVISTQLFGVLQVSYLGLKIVLYKGPLFAPFKILKLAHGLNLPLSSFQTDLPPQIVELGFYNSLVNNLNLTLVLPLIAISTSLTFLAVQKIVKTAEESVRLKSFFRLAIGEYLMVGLLFCLYNFSFSMSVFVESPSEKGQLFVGSVIQIILYLACLVTLLVFYSLRQKEFFGQFKQFFRGDSFSQRYYYIPVAERVLIGCLLGTSTYPIVQGAITVVVLVLSLIALTVKRPYLETRQNGRAICNQVISIAILALYLFLSIEIAQSSMSVQSMTCVPLVVLALISLAVLVNLVFLVIHIVLHVKEERGIRIKRHQTANDFITQNCGVEPQTKPQEHGVSMQGLMDVSMDFQRVSPPRRRRRRGVKASASNTTQTQEPQDAIPDFTGEKIEEVLEF